MSLAWNQLGLAVHELVGTGTQRQRLATSYDLHLSQLRKKDLPQEIRNEFSAMAMEIDDGKRAGHDLPAIGAAMSDERINVLMNGIVNMYDAVTRYEPLLAPEHQGAPTVRPGGVPERRQCNLDLRFR